MDIFEPQTFLHESAFCPHETSEFDTETELFWKCTPERFKTPVHASPGKKYAISNMSGFAWTRP